MVQKDYNLIARAIKGSDFRSAFSLVDNIVLALERNDPKFDRQRFYDDCGVKADDDDTRSNK